MTMNVRLVLGGLLLTTACNFKIGNFPKCSTLPLDSTDFCTCDDAAFFNPKDKRCCGNPGGACSKTGDNKGGTDGGMPTTSSCALSGPRFPAVLWYGVFTARGAGFVKACEPFSVTWTYANLSQTEVPPPSSQRLPSVMLVISQNLSDPGDLLPPRSSNADWNSLDPCGVQPVKIDETGIDPKNLDHRGLFAADLVNVPGQGPHSAFDVGTFGTVCMPP
jgi:hypothetical protein